MQRAAIRLGCATLSSYYYSMAIPGPAGVFGVAGVSPGTEPTQHESMTLAVNTIVNLTTVRLNHVGLRLKLVNQY